MREETTVARIVHALEGRPHGATRLELAAWTGLRENQVTGRVHELLTRGELVVRGRRQCAISGRRTEVVAVPVFALVPEPTDPLTLTLRKPLPRDPP